jgi:hypothetical protein
MSYYSPIDFVDSIQDAYDEVVANTGVILKSETVDLQANLSYYDMRTLLPDFLCIMGAWSVSQKRWLIPVSYRELDDIRDDWELAIGSPYLFCPVNYRYITIYPKPSSTTGQLYIFYKATADVLAGDTIPQIPIELSEAILREYVIGDLHEQQMEFTKAQMRWEIYVQKMQELVKLMASRQQERLPRLGGM